MKKTVPNWQLRMSGRRSEWAYYIMNREITVAAIAATGNEEADSKTALMVRAVPELLAVCKQLLEDDERAELLTDEACAALRAAIAKAEGRPT